MSLYNYKKRDLFSGPHFLGLLLMLAGLLAFLSPYLFSIGVSARQAHYTGLITFLIGLSIVSFYEGIMFDFAGKRYREYYTILGLKLGQWSALPTITNLEVVSKTKRVSNTPNGISPTLSGNIKEFYVLLLDDQQTPRFKMKFVKQNAAETCARQISTGLNLITDYSESK